MGYNNQAWVVPAYEDIFVRCATKGLVSYIEGKTLKESVNNLITEYDNSLKNAKMNPIYGLLLRNKQALVTIVNSEEKTIND